MAGADVESFRASSMEFAANSFEGHQRLTIAGGWKPIAWTSRAALCSCRSRSKVAARVAMLETAGTGCTGVWENSTMPSTEGVHGGVTWRRGRGPRPAGARSQLRKEFASRLVGDASFAKDPQLAGLLLPPTCVLRRALCLYRCCERDRAG